MWWFKHWRLIRADKFLIQQKWNWAFSSSSSSEDSKSKLTCSLNSVLQRCIGTILFANGSYTLTEILFWRSNFFISVSFTGNSIPLKFNSLFVFLILLALCRFGVFAEKHKAAKIHNLKQSFWLVFTFIIEHVFLIHFGGLIRWPIVRGLCLRILIFKYLHSLNFHPLYYLC